MRAWVLTATDGPQALRLETLPQPDPGPGEVRVRLKAAALNHRDLWISKGQYAKIRLPAVVGSDGAGVVDAVGPDVTDDWQGREVVINPAIAWGDDPRIQGRDFRVLGMPDQGTLAECVVVPAVNVAPKPEHLDWHAASALPLAGLTAWRALMTRARCRPQERVLVTGIGGGVATMALMLASAQGAEVWVTSGSREKLDAARRLGAAGGVLYRDPDWAKALRAAAGGDIDVVIDGAVGNGLADVINVAGYGARIAVYGATLGDPQTGFNVRRLFWRHIEVLGSTMGSPQDFEAMLAFVAQHRVQPVVDRVYAFAEADAAIARMADGAQMGKIVLTHDENSPA